MLHKRTLRVSAMGITAFVLVVLMREWTRSETDRHLAAIERLRYPPQQAGLRTYFTGDYLLWNLQGRPSVENVLRKHDQHIEALVALGYLERRSFPVTKRRLEPSDGSTLNTMFQSRLSQGSLRTKLAEASFGPDLRSVIVTTRPEEMEFWADLIRDFDQASSTNQNPTVAR